MNHDDVEKYQSLLITEQQSILGEIESTMSLMRRYSIVNLDTFDLADKGSSPDGLSTQLLFLKKRMGLVEAAIKRINEGTFGICKKCGNPINSERLDILPYAEYCIQCKSRIKMYKKLGS